MRRGSHIVWALAAVLLLVAAPAFAQGGGASSTGSISGQVKDSLGAVLPGVTVTSTSPAQIGTLTLVTNDAGIYRFPSAPPGEYKLQFELLGFLNVVREGVLVTVGFNVEINVELGVATLQETVTVRGQTPVIDRSATRVQTNYDQQQLASLPNARDMMSLLSTTPSVTLFRPDVGGTTMGNVQTYWAYGHAGQNRPLIEGINITDGTATAGFYLDYGSFEEVFIGTAGNSAEMPNPGVLTQFVSKGGGNTLSVNLYADFETEDLQDRNLTPDQKIPNTDIGENGNRLTSYRNLNIGVGGPILREKVWGFLAYVNQQNSIATAAGGVFLDGTLFETKLFNYTAKGTYQINQRNKIIGYLQHATKLQPHRSDPNGAVHITADSTVRQDSPAWAYKGEWNGTIGQNLFVESRAGQFGSDFALVSNTSDRRYQSIDTRHVMGGGRDWMNRPRRNQFTGALAYFKDAFAGGSHTLKAGGEYLDESGNTVWHQGYSDNVIHFVRGDLTGPLAATTPDSVRLYNNSNSENALATTSIFVTDTWTIDRLTLNLGARLDRYRAWLPEQTLPAGRFVPQALTFPEVSKVVAFTHLVPRLGATYDLTGNGKAVVKANWGRFAFNPGVNLADAVNPNTSTQYAVWTWNDLNGDRVFQDHEGSQLTQQVGGAVSTSIDPDLENSYTDEALFFVERELLPDLGLRIGYVWKHDANGWQQINVLRPGSAYNVPVRVVDPGPDGRVDTTADNGVLNLFNLDDTSRGIANQVRNIPGYEGSYRTLELSAKQRYGRRWSMQASYSFTRVDEFSANYFGNTFASTSPFSLSGSYSLSPNDHTHHEYTTWNAKVSGSVDIGWGLRVTPVLKMQSGAPYSRFVSVQGCSASVTINCLNYGTQSVLVEPIGTRRHETIAVLDYRVEKQIRLFARARAAVFFDMFNTFNANTAYSMVWQSGSRFERATGVVAPRIVKLGAKFDW